MTDFVRDLKEMMAAWDKYRAIWIKKHGNDEGFAKWYQEQIAGLERKAKSSPPQFKDAGANDKQESNKDFIKRIGSRRNGYSAKTASTSLSAICDRELARVGLAKARYEVLDDSEIVIAEADSLSDARYAAEKAEKSGQRRVMIYDNQTGKTVAFSSKVESTRLARVGLAREDCDKCGKPNPKWKEQNFCDKCREGHLKQIADAKAQQTVGVDKQYLKPSLSAICDRELQRVGLAAGDSGGMTYTVHFHSADDKKWFIKKAKLVSNEYDDLGQMAIKVDHGIASIAKNSPHVYSVE